MSRILVLFTALLIGGCHASDAASRGKGVARPLDVASVIAGCKRLDDCIRRCTEKTPGSCVSAGRLYEFGHGVPSDPSRAFTFYERACNAKFAGGCYNAAVLLAAGKGVAKDLPRARQLYAKVCQMGSKTSCERARAASDEGSSGLAP